MTADLKDKLLRTSKGPGVYLMKDADGRVIYVGKARNLKSRLSSYFNAPTHPDVKTGVLVQKIANFETVVTASELEALILESNLIKRHRPRYNVILKDDKRYPVLRIDATNPYPNLTVVRKIAKDGALYFGPYPSGKAVQQTIKIINKTFKLRKCRKSTFRNRTRPCLHYQMGQCLGPCCLAVDKQVYDDMVREVVLFLNGRTPDLIRKIKKEMLAASEAREFETAAMQRDKMFSIEHVTKKQVVVTPDFKDRDVLAVARAQDVSIITLLIVRGGYLVGFRHFEVQETLASDAEMTTAFIRQYYEHAHQVPGEILLPVEIDDASLLEEWLKTSTGKRIRIRYPQRGEKLRLVTMARQNADNQLNDILRAAHAELDLLQRLQKRLKLDRLPVRIECFDNSNTFGTHPVSGMVVFTNAKPEKTDYRSYKIRNVSRPDDYATMAEVLRRRYGKKDPGLPNPDLLMVDGGRGQLNIARAVIASLGMEGEFNLLGIAKKDEKKGEPQDKVFLPGRSNPVIFGRDADVLLFLQRIRDESHRFAISFHRRRRRSAAVQSVLDTIPGIGKKRKQALLKHFGSVKKIRTASLGDLLRVSGMNQPAAEAVQKHFSNCNKNRLSS